MLKLLSQDQHIWLFYMVLGIERWSSCLPHTRLLSVGSSFFIPQKVTTVKTSVLAVLSRGRDWIQDLVQARQVLCSSAASLAPKQCDDSTSSPLCLDKLILKERDGWGKKHWLKTQAGQHNGNQQSCNTNTIKADSKAYCRATVINTLPTLVKNQTEASKIDLHNCGQ